MTRALFYLNTLFSWLRLQRPRLMSGFVRAILWGAAVGVALWPSIRLSNARWSLDVYSMSTVVNSSGHFRDFFFITIVISIIGLGNIFDNISASFRRSERVGTLSYVAFTLLGIYFLGTLFYSLPEFMDIARAHGTLNQDALSQDSDIVRNTIWAGVAAELVIAMREKPHENNEGRGNKLGQAGTVQAV